MDKYLEFIIRNRRIVIAITVVLFIFSSVGLMRLRISTDFRIYLGTSTDDVKNLDLLENTFTKNETLFIMLSPENGDIFNPEAITAIQELTELSWKTPYSRRVDSITNYQYSVSAGDELIVGDLVPKHSADDKSELARLKRIAINEPFLKDSLVSADGSTAAIQITLNLSDDITERMKQTPSAVDYVRKTVDTLKARYPQLEFHVAGSVMMNHVMGEAALGDITLLIPICYTVITILMYFLLRNAWGVGLTLGIVTITNTLVLGISGWADHILAPVIGFVPNAILIISVADCIHILTTYYSELHKGKPKETAIKNSLKNNFFAVSITSLTTIMGFLCLNFNDAPPYRDLGNMVAFGAFIAYVLSISFLPAVLAALPATDSSKPPLFSSSMALLGKHVITHHKSYILFSAILTSILGLAVTKNELNDNWNEYFDKTFALRVAIDAIDRKITGVHRIDYAIKAPEGSSISNPQYLAFLDSFHTWYKSQPEIAYVSSVTDTFKRLNKNMHADAPAYYSLPDSEALASQYLLFYEMSLPFGLDLNHQVSFNKDMSRMTVIINKTTSENILKIKERADGWLKANTPPTMHVSDATGIDIAFSNIARSNTHSMLWGTALAFLLISITLALLTKSWRYGALSLVPNIMPAVCAFGIWGLTVSQIGLATSAIVCMAIGIIVDDTVHYMSKYRFARHHLSMSPREAAMESFSTVGMAMVITSVILVAGFIVLGFSPFQPTSQLGSLLAMTIFLALIFDLFLLPSLLIFIDERSMVQPEKTTCINTLPTSINP